MALGLIFCLMQWQDQWWTDYLFIFFTNTCQISMQSARIKNFVIVQDYEIRQMSVKLVMNSPHLSQPVPLVLPMNKWELHEEMSVYPMMLGDSSQMWEEARVSRYHTKHGLFYESCRNVITLGVSMLVAHLWKRNPMTKLFKLYFYFPVSLPLCRIIIFFNVISGEEGEQTD